MNKVKFTQNSKNIEKIILFVLLLFLAVISYVGVDESVSVVKYHFIFRIDLLVKNYNLYLHSLKDLFANTLLVYRGDSAAQWSTPFHIFPLFIFSDMLGGLSLRNIYLFTITTSLILILLFYYWIKKYWNSEIAFFATFFLGFSAIFQEFSRSGSYISSSIMFALIWIIYIYKCLNYEKAQPYFFLGLLTGTAMYGYGMLRSLFLVACVQIFLSRRGLRSKRFLLFFLGTAILILPGIILKINTVDFKNCKDYFHLFFDPANVHSLKELSVNLGNFSNRILGGNQIIEPYITNNFHAHFLNRLLVIPFIVGVVHAFRCKKEAKYRLLLIISFAIYFTPLFTAKAGYAEARRSLLYVIPTYLFIGFGINGMLDFIKSLPSIISKQLLHFFILCGFVFIIFSESHYINYYILRNNRDLGILRFANNIKKLIAKGNLYYLEAEPNSIDIKKRKRFFSVYKGGKESNILEVALMDGKNNSFRLMPITDSRQIDLGPESFYLAKSPMITKEEFESLCKRNGFICRLIEETPVINFPSNSIFYRPRDVSFKLYFISRQKK
jgi:hypothetical protein